MNMKNKKYLYISILFVFALAISCSEDKLKYKCIIQSTNTNPPTNFTDLTKGHPDFSGSYLFVDETGQLPEPTISGTYAELNFGLGDDSDVGTDSVISITVTRADRYSTIQIYLYKDSDLLQSGSLDADTDYTNVTQTVTNTTTLKYTITSEDDTTNTTDTTKPK